MSRVIAAVVTAAFAVAAIIALGPACGIDTRSDTFRCDEGVCPAGRNCVDGWCVSAAGDGGDDGGGCPPGCSFCEGSTCVYVCDTPSACGARITCPAGRPCRVECTGTQACAGGVDCTAASGCTINCQGPMSCVGSLTCGMAACAITCGGNQSCPGGIDCRAACKCDVVCSGTDSCFGDTRCPSPPCQQGMQCTSAGTCNRC